MAGGECPQRGLSRGLAPSLGPLLMDPWTYADRGPRVPFAQHLAQVHLE